MYKDLLPTDHVCPPAEMASKVGSAMENGQSPARHKLQLINWTYLYSIIKAYPVATCDIMTYNILIILIFLSSLFISFWASSHVLGPVVEMYFSLNIRE